MKRGKRARHGLKPLRSAKVLYRSAAGWYSSFTQTCFSHDFLGIDCGTQSTKTIALDWDTGEVLASAQQAYGFVPNLPAGAMEQNPQDWVDAAEQSIGEVIAKLGSRKEEIRGIGVSGQQHGLVVLDKNDQVVRPAKLWNDTTTGSNATRSLSISADRTP